ncbi:thiol peroxidase [Stomatohabitans albus]|uniref:thiol peroxidase n=1 Tax=Stomatohabitans albus TaxID=3110766 RepID=UPI00300CDE6E
MASLTFRGTPVNTNADFIAAGAVMPEVKVVTGTLDEIQANEVSSGTVILNIFPSIDTGVCATSVETFSSRAKEEDLSVINLSVDTPFAQERFAADNNIEGVTFGSFARNRDGLANLGALMVDGPLENFAARSVVVVKDGKVVYSQLVEEIAQEPDYDAAIAAATA